MIGRALVEGDGIWHALYTRHQHEKTIADTLAGKGFQVFLPLYSSLRLWKDRRKQLTLPLFPCYVFVRDIAARRLDVLTTPGVCYIVSTNREPTAIASPELEQIRRAVESSRHIEPYPFLTVGDRVRVHSGPLEGLEGILVRKKGMDRLVLSLELLGRSAAVEVDITAVELLQNGNRADTVNFTGANPTPARLP